MRMAMAGGAQANPAHETEAKGRERFQEGQAEGASPWDGRGPLPFAHQAELRACDVAGDACERTPAVQITLGPLDAGRGVEVIRCATKAAADCVVAATGSAAAGGGADPVSKLVTLSASSGGAAGMSGTGSRPI
jgi:hypothetical protein